MSIIHSFHIRISFLFLFVISLTETAAADQAQTAADQAQAAADKAEAAADKAEADKADKAEAVAKAMAEVELQSELNKMGFGYGIAFIQNISGGTEVKNAFTDEDGILRVEERSDTRVGFILETHFLLGDETQKKIQKIRGEADGSVKNANLPPPYINMKHIKDILWGPYVSVELGEDVIRSLGAGVMITFRKVYLDGLTQKSSFLETFNLALGLQVDPEVKMLADGFFPNQDVGVGFQPRFKEGTQVGLTIMFSRNF